MEGKWLKIEQFEGKGNENPCRYIESLERLFSCEQFNEKSKIAIACSHIQGEAMEWWETIKNKPKTFEEYQRVIMERYWGVAQQERERWEIERNEREEEEKYSTFVQRQMARITKINKYQIPEEQQMRIAGRNLPREIKQIIEKETEITGVLKKLQEIENDDYFNQEEDKGIRIANMTQEGKGEEPRRRQECPIIDVSIQGFKARALLDTGSQVSVMSQELFNEIAQEPTKIKILPLKGTQIVLANGRKAKIQTKQVWAKISIAGQELTQVVLILEGLIHDLVLGSDFMRTAKCNIDYGTELARIGTVTVPFKSKGNEEPEGRQAKLQCITIKEEIKKKTEEITGPDGENKERIQEILGAHESVFSDKPGVIRGYEHRIRLSTGHPYQTRAYPIPFQYRKEIEAQLKQMTEWGVISKCTSPYNNPILAVKKGDGSIRLCLDARQLNRVTIPDTNAPPVMNELMTKFRNKQIFSTLDLTNSYWQMSLHPDDRQYTAFKYNGRAYQFNRVPFGLKNSGAGLIQCLDQTLSDEVKGFATMYVDDIIIASDNIEEHCQHLGRLLQECEQKGIKINIKKSHFATQEVKFLGHIVSPDGVRPNPEKIQAIQEFPTPKKKKDIKAFLGMCTFYNKFYENFTHDMEPLLQLLRKEQAWVWDVKRERSFRKVKEGFLKQTILSHPAFDQTFWVQTDSSDIGLGATLYQKGPKGEQRVLAFISRLLKDPERRYTVTEREALAIVWAFKRFRQYLVGSQVKVVTDHRSLEFLNKSFLTNNRLVRWSLALQEFQYEVEYCKGRDNVIADTLSRYPIGIQTNTETSEFAYIAATTRQDSKGGFTTSNIRRSQEKDEDCRQIINYLRKGKSRTGSHQGEEGTEGGPLWKYRDRCITLGGLLQRNTGNGKQTRIIIPSEMRSQMIDETHRERGHYGVNKTEGYLSNWFYWPGMHRDIAARLRRCDVCARTKPLNRSNEGPQTPIIIREPNHTLAIDYYGPLPMAGGKRYIFVTYDLCSKMVATYPMARANAHQTIKVLEKKQFPIIGKPRYILSDHGTPFVSKTWRQWINRTGVKHHMSSIRNPQSNPCERVMRELGRLLRVYTMGDHRKWIQEIPRITGMINSSKNESTGFEPSRLHYGRPIPYPYDDRPAILIEKIDRRQDNQIALRRLEQMGRRRTQTQKPTQNTFKVGDRVMVKANPVSRPGQNIYKKFLDIYEGPYEIVRAYGNNAFALAHGKGTFNARALKRAE